MLSARPGVTARMVQINRAFGEQLMSNNMKWIVVAMLAATSIASATAAEQVIVESRKADGTPNTPAWTEISGNWGRSKNKSAAAEGSSMVATNVSICVTNQPKPAFKVSPEGLEAGTAYTVEVTFSTSSTYAAAPDLVVAVTVDGVSANSIPTNTVAFKGSGADVWTELGTITPSADPPTLTFTYFSGTLSPTSRWYADAIRFTPKAD